MPSGRLSRTADGRLSFDMADAPIEQLYPLVDALQQRFGLGEVSPPHAGLEDVVIHGQIDGQPMIVGYDNWSGCYVQAASEGADAVIERIAATLGQPGAALWLEPASEPEPTGVGIAPYHRPRRRQHPIEPEHPPREVEREVALFRHMPGFDEQRTAMAQQLLQSRQQSRADVEKRRFRYQAIQALARLMRSQEDFALLLANLDAVIDEIPRESEEDISGYHHSFDMGHIQRAADASATLGESLHRLFDLPGVAIRRPGRL